jgi:hypothetical protein
MYDLKLQCDGSKSVVRIRLVKTEGPSECVTLNSKVSAALHVFLSTLYKVSINPITQSKHLLISHVQTPYMWQYHCDPEDGRYMLIRKTRLQGLHSVRRQQITTWILTKWQIHFLQEVRLLATCIHLSILLVLLDPEVEDDMFSRNVGWFSTDYTALHPRR